MMTKRQILAEMNLFSLSGDGIGGWISERTDEELFQRLGRIPEEPLTKVQLNQLLVLGREAPLSDGFFQYYWLTASNEHTYNVMKLPGFQQQWLQSTAIMSLDHLKWGLYRLFVDGLLYFGNVRTAYRKLRTLTFDKLVSFYRQRRFDTQLIKQRGPGTARPGGRTAATS
jgi:hypothetical protein